MDALQAMRQKLETEAKVFQGLQKESSKSAGLRTQFQQQQQENNMVLKELELLEEEANVYKLVGPMLIKQDLVEAKSNVGKRLEYIGDEIKRLDNGMKSLEKKQAEKQQEVVALQQKMQQLQTKGQAQAQAAS
ncbi:hypothetical protein CYMTET_33829 [Cymbomonas tetramitiformis]|uniref:Prefoldin subunit 6 n=1 Tax=Cymbomonas tetramitiformis TaxID=36881 RepID=A0AAE0KQK1_9CHLO|nr:hypothetical protein CYMTET_33829 [Cymbomonas tetramitiformis]